MTDFTQIFNNKLLEFQGELKENFPQVSQFALLENLTRGAIMMGPNIPQTMFQTSVVVPYASFIESENEDFLLANKYDEISNIDNNLISNLKMIWQEMNAENKKAIWQYMKILVALSKKIQSQQTV